MLANTPMSEEQIQKRDTMRRALRIINAALNAPERHASHRRIHGITLHTEGYAELGYTTPECGVIALANWNSVGEGDTKDNTMPLIGELFEKLGAEIEWSDEWTECDGCRKLIRTKPDCYDWKPYYVMDDDMTTCGECVKKDPEDYLLSLESNPQKANVFNWLDPKEHGYVLFHKDYENDWHMGQDDNPKEIAKDLNASGITRFLFSLDHTGQFDIRFSCWVHKEEAHLLNKASL